MSVAVFMLLISATQSDSSDETKGFNSNQLNTSIGSDSQASILVVYITFMRKNFMHVHARDLMV
jgi:hypothetical protein